MVCHRVQPGTPAISYKLITTIVIRVNVKAMTMRRIYFGIAPVISRPYVTYPGEPVPLGTGVVPI